MPDCPEVPLCHKGKGLHCKPVADNTDNNSFILPLIEQMLSQIFESDPPSHLCKRKENSITIYCLRV